MFLSWHRSARHIAGGIGTIVCSYVCTYMVRIVCTAHAQVTESENSITLTIYTSENILIALGAENDYRFHEYTYQDPEYIIRAMNT